MKRSNERSIVMLSVLALTATIFPGCATTRSAGEQLDDAMTTARVGRRLSRDPDVPRRFIDVDTIDGEVTLRGEVPDHRARAEAVEVAARTEGVRVVHDRLEVRPNDDHAPDGDAAITAKINNRIIADPDVRASNVDIDTFDGVVTLSGVVANEVARREAERIAVETDGVAAVINELQVAGPDEVALRPLLPP